MTRGGDPTVAGPRTDPPGADGHRMIRNETDDDPDDGGNSDPEVTRPLSRQDPRNVLVLGDFNQAGSVWVPENPADETLLAVSYVRQAHEYVERWEEVGGDPDRVAVIEARSGELPSNADSSELVRREAPGDLTGIGIQSSEFLTRWRDEEGPTVVFDSLTVLLQYTSVDTAFQFLHVFTSRVRDADGRGYYYLNPTAHDDKTVATLKQLFDDLVTA